MNENIRKALEGLKRATLQVLYEKQEAPPTPVDILMELGIPLVKDTKGSETSLVCGILAHLKNDGYAVYNSDYAGWQITEKGVKVICHRYAGEERRTDRS